MSELLLPEGFRPISDPETTPFNAEFFIEHFHSNEPPSCEHFEQGETPVVELELMNGETCDVYYFEAFRKRMLVALLFVDPPKCDDFYRSFIRYETIFRVNIRYYPPAGRALGFKADYPTFEEVDEEHPLLLEAARKNAPEPQ